MKYLIACLGNIGVEYDNTRHNIGFKVADYLNDDLKGTFTTGRLAQVSELRYKGRTIVLIKPTTYMNLSGKAVKYWMQQEKIPVENVLIIVDDLSLPVGAIRMKQNGSDAGHNGLKHIAQMLSTQNYNRLKFGIGNDFPRGGQVDFVLGKFSPEDNKTINEKVPVACDAIKAFALSGMQFAMCHYNNK